MVTVNSNIELYVWYSNGRRKIKGRLLERRITYEFLQECVKKYDVEWHTRNKAKKEGLEPCEVPVNGSHKGSTPSPTWQFHRQANRSFSLLSPVSPLYRDIQQILSWNIKQCRYKYRQERIRRCQTSHKWQYQLRIREGLRNYKTLLWKCQIIM